jgi:hypothetical protein
MENKTDSGDGKASPAAEMPLTYEQIRQIVETSILVMDRIRRGPTTRLKRLRQFVSDHEARGYAMDNHLWDRNHEMAIRIVKELKAQAWTPEKLDQARDGLTAPGGK